MSLFLPNCTGFTKKSHYGLYGLNQKLIKKPHPISLIDLKPKTEKNHIMVSMVLSKKY